MRHLNNRLQLIRVAPEANDTQGQSWPNKALDGTPFFCPATDNVGVIRENFPRYRNSLGYQGPFIDGTI